MKYSPSFGRIPYSLADSGKIATLTGAEAKALLIICAHVNGKEVTARPSIERITELSGHIQRTMEKAIVALKEKGILHITPGGGRSNCNVYRVLNPGVQTGDCEGKTPAQRPGFNEETPACRPLNPGVGAAYIRKNRIEQRDTAAPPASGNGLESKSSEDHRGNGAGGRIVTLWVDGFKKATGRDFSQSARGKTAGTLKRLLSDYGEETLSAAVGRWFGAKRTDYGIELFNSRLNGGSAELLSPKAQEPSARELRDIKNTRKLMEGSL